MTDLVFGPDAKPWEETSARLSQILDAGIEANHASQPPRDYLGMSRLGEECARKLFYEYTHAPKDPGKDFGGRTLRIFQRGHDCEARMARYLRMAGFELLTERPDGRQFGIYLAKDPETGRARIAGHCDGIVTGWASSADNPLPLPAETLDWIARTPFPLLWECKGVNNKNFQKYQRQGIKKANPVYYAQMQLYMAYLELEHALFTAENQDTCEIFAELVPFVPRDAQEASDRGVRVIAARSAEELPRVAGDPTDFRCRICDFAERCWSASTAPQAPATVPRPTWLE